MEWLTCIRTAIDYMEEHLHEDIHAADVAGEVYLSPFFLQKGFSMMTGYGVAEYLRNRRLYEAALDLQNSDDKVIDIALHYAYDTPESFTKAFTRFHGATPSQVRDGQASIRTFLPLKINITIQGGNQMEYQIKTMVPFKVIGFQKEFSYENSYEEIPKFWDEIGEKGLMTDNIGEFGICIDDVGGEKFRYLIAGKYDGGDIPEGMTVYEFPEGDWAVFDCIGTLPEALQSVNTRIFKEWLPGNPDYEIAGNANVEWYDCGDTDDPNYHSAIWIPVKKKG